MIVPPANATCPNPYLAAQSGDLDALRCASRFRSLVGIKGADFASNDYLGIASSGLLSNAAHEAWARGVPLGSGGSRLLRGNHEEHEILEAEAAAFFGAEAALFFSTGFAANSALLSTLPQREDLVVHDALIHASAHEGMRLGRAQTVSARHNDVADVAERIAAWRANGGMGRVWIIAESLYSMDGDCAPLADLHTLSIREGAILVVDEAHATGVFGDDGRGLAAALSPRDNIITLHTCGKALGAEGALICGPAVVRDFLINRGRGFIFSTAPSPFMAALVRAGLALLKARGDLRDALWDRIRLAEECLAASGAVSSGSQILPCIIGDDAKTMEIASALQNQGFDVRGIRPPTVPIGTSRLRISITNNVDAGAIEALGQTLAELRAAA